MNSHLKAFVTPANGDVNPKRFDGAFKAARAYKPDPAKHVKRMPTGHNREHAWILWSKIQRGHITNPATIKALRAEYGELFEEFEAQTGTQAA